jgi:hypothetical protein
VTVMNFVRPIARSDRRHYYRAVLVFFVASMFIVPLSSPAAALDAKQNPTLNSSRTPTPSEAPTRHFESTFKPSNRRDPFLNPLLGKKSSKSNEDEEESRGVPPPGIGGTLITQAMLQGISMRDTGKVAIVRGADTRAYFLREGDRLFDGYLKAIDADSITLVRETKMKSGKVFTQAVTKRLRTP